MTWKSILASAPFGVLAVKAGSLFNLACTHPLPLFFAHGGALLAGLGIAAVPGSIGFAWNVLCIIPSETWRSPSVFFMASSIDLLLGVTLIIGVGVQSIYVPHTQGGCSMVDDNGMSLFTFLGDIRQVSAASICSEFFTIWVFGILAGLLSLCGSYTNYVRFSRIKSRLPYRRQSDYHLVTEGSCCVPPPTTHINTLISFSMQYFQKWKIRRSFLDEHKSLHFSSDREAKSGSHTTLPVQNIPLQHSIALAKSLQRVDTCRLEQLLSSYPIFVSIIQGLHYSELICLSQTSSNMYQRVLGNSRPVSLSQLRLLCCDEEASYRYSCWSCKALICKSCLSLRQVRQPTTASHLQHCKPYCSTCYYHQLYYSARNRHHVMDKCHAPRFIGYSFVQLCALCTQDHDKQEAAPQDHDKQEAAPRVKRERREAREILKLAKERDTCNSCDARLTGSGPRWWACSTCRAGCLSHYHPAWVDNDHGKGDGPSAGDQAVYIRGN